MIGRPEVHRSDLPVGGRRINCRAWGGAFQLHDSIAGAQAMPLYPPRAPIVGHSARMLADHPQPGTRLTTRRSDE